MDDGQSYYYHTPAPGPIRPIGNIGDWVVVTGTGQGLNLYKIADRDSLPKDPLLCANGGALTVANAVLGPVQTDSVLNLPGGVLGQFRFTVIDNVMVEVHQPAPFHSVQGGTLRFTPHNTGEGDYLTELYSMGQANQVTLLFRTLGIRDLRTTLVQFYGYRYTLYGRGTPNTTGPGRVAAGASAINPIITFDNIADFESWTRSPDALRAWGPFTKPVPIVVSHGSA